MEPNLTPEEIEILRQVISYANSGYCIVTNQLLPKLDPAELNHWDEIVERSGGILDRLETEDAVDDANVQDMRRDYSTLDREIL